MAVPKVGSWTEGSGVGSAVPATSVKGISSSLTGRALDGFSPFSISFSSGFFVNLIYGVVFAIVSIPAIAKITKIAQSQESIHIIEAGMGRKNGNTYTSYMRSK